MELVLLANTFNVIKFKSEPKISPFAPEWDWTMFESNILNVNWDSISDIILLKEKEIINLYPILQNKYGLDGDLRY